MTPCFFVVFRLKPIPPPRPPAETMLESTNHFFLTWAQHFMVGGGRGRNTYRLRLPCLCPVRRETW